MYDPALLYQDPILGNFSVAPGKEANVMPYVVVEDTNSCPATKPWAVKNEKTGEVRGRCHATKESAIEQQKALYVAMKREAVMSEYFLIPVENLFAEGDAPTQGDNVRWVQAFPYDSWGHPVYGTTTVTPEIGQQYVQNFRDNVRGQDLAINYNHGEDKAKGDKAAGWIKDVAARPDGVFFKVEFTPTAVEELKNGEWRYFSSEVYDEWTNPHSNETFQYVVSGGALTNKPWVKGMLPINFSEVADVIEGEKDQKEFTEWSDAYKNSLPDSSFLYIESGGQKNSEGKTEPLSLRHLPYKDENGKIDIPHLRDAVARAPQLVGTDEADRKALQSKGQRLLAGAEKMSTLSKFEAAKLSEAMAVLESAGLDVVDESKEWEHSEPGTGPTPVLTPTEKDAETGSRRGDLPEGFPDTLKPESKLSEEQKDAAVKLGEGIRSGTALKPNASKGGTVDGKVEWELRNMFDVDENGDLVEAAKLKFGELDSLKRAIEVSDQERQFAEKYPQLWEEHNKLMVRDRDNAAKNFAETVSKVRKSEGHALKETRQGLSARALDIIQDTHKKFSESKATVADFEECVKTIINGGIVEFSELGSSQGDGEERLPEIDNTSPNGIANARKMFAELVAKEQKENPDTDFVKAMQTVAKKHPDLAETYAVTLPA